MTDKKALVKSILKIEDEEILSKISLLVAQNNKTLSNGKITIPKAHIEEVLKRIEDYEKGITKCFSREETKAILKQRKTK